MKQSLFIIFLFTLLVPVQAQQNHVYTVENIPKTHLMNKMQYVTDPANILSQEARDTIDHLLYKLENATGIESVVAIVPSIGNADCFEFSHELLNNWGVGKKGKDNGLVILLVTDQRCIQFYNGYGLEGDLPDAISKRIQTQIMLPYLKNGDWNNAMVSGVRAVYSRLDGSMENDEVSGGDDISLGRIILSIIVIIVLIFWLIRGGGGGLGPFIGGMLGGGLFGGNGGSGGFGGGSFGGGRGGGGGAGTRF